MKQKQIVALMALTTILMLLAPLIPHHHHDGVWCNVVEQCCQDKVANDIHTHHHGDKSTCVEEAEYLAPKHLVEKQVQASQCHKLLLFIPLLTQLLWGDDVGSLKNRFGEMTNPNYTSVYVDTSGLRAPPVGTGRA